MDHLLWESGFKARQFDRTGCWDEADGCSGRRGFARKAGARLQEVPRRHRDACLSWLRNNEAALKKLGASGTPSFFINGRYLSGAGPPPTSPR